MTDWRRRDVLKVGGSLVAIGAGAAAGPVFFGETTGISETTVDHAVVVMEEFEEADVSRERALVSRDDTGTEFAVDLEVESTGDGPEEVTVSIPVENRAPADVLVGLTLFQEEGSYPLEFEVGPTGEDDFDDGCEIEEVAEVSDGLWRFHFPATCRNRLEITVSVPDEELPAYYRFGGTFQPINAIPAGSASDSGSVGVSDVRDLDTQTDEYDYQPEVDVTAIEAQDEVVAGLTIWDEDEDVVFEDEHNLDDLEDETATATFDVGQLEIGDYEYEALADAATADPDVVEGGFSVVDELPVEVETQAASEVETSTATLNGELTTLNEDSADVFFEWREEGETTWMSTDVQTMASTGPFDDTAEDLQHSTTYEFRAIAVASDGRADTGETETFTTEAAPTGSFSGSIHDYEDDPVTNTAVTFYDGDGFEETVTTDDWGEFTVEDVPEGTYEELLYTAEGYWEMELETFEVVQDQDTDLGDIMLIEDSGSEAWYTMRAEVNPGNINHVDFYFEAYFPERLSQAEFRVYVEQEDTDGDPHAMETITQFADGEQHERVNFGGNPDFVTIEIIPYDTDMNEIERCTGTFGEVSSEITLEDGISCDHH